LDIHISCMQCLEEQVFPNSKFEIDEMNNSGLLYTTCSNGHNSLTIIQEHKFEILFDFGVMALLDGYPRESITSISASLERFYEYYINIICLKHNIKIENFDNLWKNVDNQSERQFGAYLFVYFIDKQGETPPIIDDIKPTIENQSKNNTKTWKSFRNNVVHKGYIPSKKEVLAYMELVFNHIWDLIEELKKNCKEEISQFWLNYDKKRYPKNNEIKTTNMSINTIVSLNTPRKESFEEALKDKKKSIELFKSFHLR